MQKPVSSPTAKQLASWLKEADKATGLLEVSITGLVFMIAASLARSCTISICRYPGTLGTVEFAHIGVIESETAGQETPKS